MLLKSSGRYQSKFSIRSIYVSGYKKRNRSASYNTNGKRYVNETNVGQTNSYIPWQNPWQGKLKIKLLVPIRKIFAIIEIKYHFIIQP